MFRVNSNNTDEWILPLYKIYSDDEDIELITKVLKRGTNWAIGPEIDEFEKIISDYVGTDYCVAVNSGTSALHSLMLAHGFGENDEIIVPSFTFISTVNSVLFVNSKPIFSDIENDTLGLDPQKLSNKITANTKAIIPVDYAGLSCKIFDILEIARENNLLVIEDAAEALGATINGKKVGSVADSSIFSFCGNKVLTTGEGGAVVTNSKEIYEKIKLIRSHGRADQIDYFNNPSISNYVDLGYNWRMSSITASLGISQMHKIDKIISKRRANANYITDRLKNSSDITTPNIPDGSEHVYQLYSIRLNDKHTRDSLHDYLLNKKIFSKIYFKPVHLYSFYQQKFKNQTFDLSETERAFEQILTLPMYPNMTTEEKEYLVTTILEFFEENQ